MNKWINSQLETAQSINKRADKLDYSREGILLSEQKEGAIYLHSNRDDSQNH